MDHGPVAGWKAARDQAALRLGTPNARSPVGTEVGRQ